MPAVHAVAFLELHIDPFCAAAFSPVIEIVQSVFEIEPRPHLIGGAAAPLHPIFEGHVRCVLDALGLLQRRTDDAAATAGNCGGPTAFTRLFQNDGFAARASDFDSRRNPCASPAYDHNIGLQT